MERPSDGYFNWTAEKIDELRRLRKEGHSTTQIARMFGTSRNAVIGKCHRLGLSKPFQPKPREAKPRRIRTKRPKYVAAVGALLQEFPLPPPQPTGVTFFALEANDCRYALDGFGPSVHRTFCGQPIEEPGRSYCNHHLDMAYWTRQKPKTPAPTNGYPYLRAPSSV